MADNALFAPSGSLIAGRFAVDTGQGLLDAGGGLPAYAARDRMASDGRRVALAVSRDASPRSRHLTLLTEPIDNLMTPLGHGVAPMTGATAGANAKIMVMRLRSFCACGPSNKSRMTARPTIMPTPALIP